MLPPTRLAIATFLASSLTAVPGVAQEELDAPRVLADPSLQLEIDQALDSGILHLQRAQHRDGSWTGAVFGSYRAGPTAFTAYALVASGISPSSPSIQLAIDYLERNPPTMVYSAGAILLLLGEIGDEQHRPLAQSCLDRLVAWESSSIRGTWSYPSGPVDLSNMQFVALGFRAAARLGLEVPLDPTRRLVEATIERFQEEPIPLPKVGGKRGREAMAGFHYFLERERRPPSASMTAAGICIQRIARELFGKKLGSKLLRAMDESEQLGLRWLDAHWSVKENHGHHENGQLLYYLYALERLGAFFDTEQIQGHPWYEPGAREIVALQESNGGWGRLHATAYSLLFLGRASRLGTTGDERSQREDLWSLESGAVQLRASGSMEIVMWIEEIESEDPVHLDTVEWLVDGEVLETIDADETRAWSGERYPFKWLSTAAGAHAIRVRLKLASEGDSISSDPLEVRSQWRPAEWMARAARSHGQNLLLDADFEVTASSESAGQYPSRILDGYEGTAWVASPDDAEARVDLQIKKGVRARVVTLSQATSSIASIGTHVGVRRIRLHVNGNSSEHTLPPESPATILLELPKRTRVKSLAVEILEPTNGRRGFAEIGLRN